MFLLSKMEMGEAQPPVLRKAPCSGELVMLLRKKSLDLRQVILSGIQS